MNISGLVKTTTIDYPGALAAAVFTPGCNYDCGFCHNRMLLASSGKMLDDAEVLGFFEKRRGLLDGVVISGGEPTLQKDLVPFARTLKKMGYKVKLDTNGSRPQVVESLLSGGLLDYVAMDYKAPFSEYPRICGADASGVQQSIKLLHEAGIEWEMRTTVIPELSEAALVSMAQAVPVLPRYALQLFRPGQSAQQQHVYTPPEIEDMCGIVRQFQPNAFARC
ncbi:MAG: anaerobic ribonucleoside-triphosphate reductase activating protein [Christensenellaceae bacterium]|jgi:pyruvate formate lyase activating enzyme